MRLLFEKNEYSIHLRKKKTSKYCFIILDIYCSVIMDYAFAEIL